MEAQAFLLSYDSAPRPSPLSPLSRQHVVYLSQSSCQSRVELTDVVGPESGRSQIVRPRDSLALCKSFDTLSLTLKGVYNDIFANFSLTEGYALNFLFGYALHFLFTFARSSMSCRSVKTY